MVKNFIKKILNVPIEFPLKEYYLLRAKYKLNILKKREDYFKLFKNFKYNQELKPDKNITLDIAICCIDKDLEILPFCIKSIKKQILHSIDNIFLIAPKDSKLIKNIAIEYNCKFIDESKIINLKKNEINYQVNGIDRSGWIFQQLLKLHVDTISKQEYIFVIDADTVLTKPKSLISNGKIIFDFSDEYHKPYFKAYKKITGLKHNLPVSLVSHMKLFEKSKLIKLREHINKNNNENFIKSVLINLDHTEMSSFSEYETYGNFCLNSYDDIIIRYWFNTPQKINSQKINSFLKQDTFRVFHSISFHNYL